MYVPVNGLGAAGRRGFGRRGLGDLNCPGDPGCPGYVAPGSADYQTSLLQEILANQQSAVPVVQSAPVGASATSWLNFNSTAVVLGALGLVGLLLTTRGGR